MREELGAERVRREQAEQERDRLAAELEAFREHPESPVTPAGEPANPPAPPVRETPIPEEEQEPRRRSWWRALFGPQ